MDNPYSENEIDDIIQSLLGDNSALNANPVEDRNTYPSLTIEDINNTIEQVFGDNNTNNTPRDSDNSFDWSAFSPTESNESSVTEETNNNQEESSHISDYIVEEIPEVLEVHDDSNENDDTENSTIESNEEEQSNSLIEAYRNKGSIDVRETVSRFRGADWFKVVQEQVVTMLGMGGINSWATFLISRIRPKCMYLYDDDIVETANLSGQLYGMSDVGRYKVKAISDFIINNSSYLDIFGIAERFTEESDLGDIVICGFDNMVARKLAFEKWSKLVENKETEEEKSACLFIDARLAAESLQVFCMTGIDTYYMQEYERNWLFTDAEADVTVCSYKQTSYCAAMIGGFIANLFINFCTNLSIPNKRSLPFKTFYEADMMYLKTEV